MYKGFWASDLSTQPQGVWGVAAFSALAMALSATRKSAFLQTGHIALPNESPDRPSQAFWSSRYVSAWRRLRKASGTRKSSCPPEKYSARGVQTWRSGVR